MSSNMDVNANVNVETEPTRRPQQAITTGTTNPLLVLISAPSGGGKTTLIRTLLEARPQMMRAVTCTTRPPREGERDGVDYYFLDAGSFLKRVQAGMSGTWKSGFYYGSIKDGFTGLAPYGPSVSAATKAARTAARATITRTARDCASHLDPVLPTRRTIKTNAPPSSVGI